jgi:hypothetical protein
VVFRGFLEERIESSSVVWLISVNGYMIDTRSMPLEVQEVAFEKGFIPYIPAYKEKR